MKGAIGVVIAVLIGVRGLSWAGTGAPTTRGEVVGKAAHMMIVMKGWPCQRVDEATQAESRGGDDTYRISCDSQRHIYRLVTPSSGELVVERW